MEAAKDDEPIGDGSSIPESITAGREFYTVLRIRCEIQDDAPRSGLIEMLRAVANAIESCTLRQERIRDITFKEATAQASLTKYWDIAVYYQIEANEHNG